MGAAAGRHRHSQDAGSRSAGAMASEMVEIKTIDQALAWGEGWEEYARELRKQLERAEIDRQFWMEQSDFWHGQLASIVAMWIKEGKPKRKSPFDEVAA